VLVLVVVVMQRRIAGQLPAVLQQPRVVGGD